MKKIIVAILVIAVVTVAYWLGAPLFINKEVNESLEDITATSPKNENRAEELKEEQVVVLEGNFVGADDFHKSEGTAKLIKIGEKYFVRFEDNFKVTNGPDLFIHFGKDGEYSKEARIGVLKGNIGGQNYEVPKEINPEDFNEVWIWCRAFSVPFANAVLETI